MSKPAEDYLHPPLARQVSTALHDALVLLRGARSTLAAAHQPEHRELGKAIDTVLTVKSRVGMRASSGASNAVAIRYLKSLEEDS